MAAKEHKERIDEGVERMLALVPRFTRQVNHHSISIVVEPPSPLRGVAQICNLLYRRIAFGRASKATDLSCLPQPSGLQIRDTAEFNSALRPLRFSRATFSCGQFNYEI